MPSIFIFGIFPESSGKTVVATALARGLVKRGLKVAVFKPRSGHNLWYQYKAFLKCKAARSLFCEDIIKLKEASKCPLPYELLNPVDALLAPLNAKVFLERNLTRQIFLFEEDMYHHLLVERYSVIEDEKTKKILLINEKNISAELAIFDSGYIGKLMASADQIIPINSLKEWSSLFNKLSSKAICSCYQKIKQAYSNLIIEGFNDAVCPEPKIIEEADIIIGVAPGTAIFYDKKEFKKILNAMMELGKDPRALRSESIIPFARKYETLKIPPIPTESLKDYDALSEELKGIIDYVNSMC